MKPAPEPAFARPKPLVPLEAPYEACPFTAQLCYHRRIRSYLEIILLVLQTSRFSPGVLTHKGPALSCFVDDRVVLHPRGIYCLLTQQCVRQHACASCGTLSDFPLSITCLCCVTPSPKTSNWSSRGRRTLYDHHDTTKLPPLLVNRSTTLILRRLLCCWLPALTS